MATPGFTNEFSSKNWVKFEGLRWFWKSQHYRITLRDFARSVQSFWNIRELVRVFRDGLGGKSPVIQLLF